MTDPDEQQQTVPDANPTQGEQEEGPTWNWWLLAIPVLALAVLVVVVLYGANVLDPADLGNDVELFHVVIAGVVVLAILFLIELALLLGRHPDHLEDAEEPAPAPETPAARGGEEPPELEAVETDDVLDGKNVLEVSRPPKWAVEAGVYATTYVEVTHDAVLRLEEIVALRP